MNKLNNLKHILKFTIFFFIFILFKFQSFAIAIENNNSCTLSGTIFDLTTFTPLSNVSIKVKLPNQEILETKTNDEGKYVIYNIPIGPCIVTVEKKGFITDTTKLFLKKAFERYDVSIESEHEKQKRENEFNITQSTDNTLDSNAQIKTTFIHEFLPCDNFRGVSGFYELPDCLVLPTNSYRLNYNVFRSKRLSDPATPYYESNYITAISYGLTENIEISGFVFKHFNEPSPFILPNTNPIKIVPPFFNDHTGFSVKYTSKTTINKKHNKMLNYAFCISHLNDDTLEIYMPVLLPITNDASFYLIPTYMSQYDNKIYFHLAYNKLLFIDHRKLSLNVELVQTKNYQWDIINGGLRLEFKNDSAINLFILSNSQQKRLTFGIGGTMLFR